MPIQPPSYPMPSDLMTPQTDQEETALSYIETAISMLKNATESLPELQPAVQQVAMILKQAIEQIMSRGQTGGGQSPVPQGGPVLPPGMLPEQMI